MRVAVLIALLALSAAACCRPLEVITKGTFLADVPPVLDRGPLCEVIVEAGSGEGRVAIIDVDGLLLNTDMVGVYSLGENPVATFREKLKRVEADRCVSAVVLRINSPGGGATASDVMWHELVTFKSRRSIPVVACLMDVGAGGGYLLASAADYILAHPTSVTGGVGVILNLYNLQDTMAQFNVLSQSVRAGENIDLGSSAKLLTPEDRALLQQMADEFHARFRATVVEARPQANLDPAIDLDGRVFTAKQALERGLIDEVGYLDDAIERARALAGGAAGSVVLLRRHGDAGRTAYAVSPNVPQQGNLLPFSIPGLDRSRMPTFMYLWQPEPTMFRLGGQ